MVGMSGGNKKHPPKNLNGPNGIRTRVTDVRGRCPRPLDDGTSSVQIPRAKCQISNRFKSPNIKTRKPWNWVIERLVIICVLEIEIWCLFYLVQINAQAFKKQALNKVL